MRVNVHSNKKITNVVEENEKLKYELDEAHAEIARLRKRLLTIGMGVKSGHHKGEKGLLAMSPKYMNFDGKDEDEEEYEEDG